MSVPNARMKDDSYEIKPISRAEIEALRGRGKRIKRIWLPLSIRKSPMVRRIFYGKG